ncbi:M48 family metallopeptidase [Bacteroides sp. 519]|uniref:M48 family metallopeptidase n=1 Tax=Bacteroides sp. 519 TaxID=2302937 RepID=UPI0013D14BC6|nr:M48 family metallopeptidase [Bacteroides sp. 519]NDV57747.1 hypothetical protein [Bacteroides sp. 519]
MEHDKAIARYSSNVIFRIILFILVYICLIVVGGILIWLAFQLAIIGFPNIIQIRNLYGMFFAAMAILGAIGFALMFGLYLFKFLFAKNKNENLNRREVKESECPQLFKTIREVAQATHCPIPKKVFISPDVNACVFYNTSFWSIFLPVRKNLEIGIGLFTALNVDELKGILAHEFGHFSQKSMKVGSGVYIANTVLHDLAFQEDKWDEWVNQWCAINVWIIALSGSLTRGFTNLVKRLLRAMYGMVNRSYMQLSRQMEYHADSIACKYTGKDVFISGLCKIDFTGATFQYSAGIVKSMMDKKKKPENVFRVHTIITDILSAESGKKINAGILLDEPIDNSTSYSRITLQNSWDSHPSIENRIANVQELTVSKEIDLRPAWELIPSDVVIRMSNLLLLNLQDISELEEATDVELAEHCEQYHKEHSVPSQYSAFLDRAIIFFDRKELTANDVLINPFTEENSKLLKELEAAIEDSNTMYGIQNKHIEAEYILYNGTRYTPKNLPVEEHLKYVESLREKAKYIDIDVYKYAINHAANEEKKEEINRLYDAHFMVQNLFDKYEYETTTQVNTIIATFSVSMSRTEEEIIEIKKYIFSMEDTIKKMIKETQWELIESFVEHEMIAPLKKFGDSESHQSIQADIDIKTIELLIELQDAYFEVIRLLYIITKVKMGRNLLDAE